MAVVQLLTQVLREEELYAEISRVCGAFGVDAMRHLLAGPTHPTGLHASRGLHALPGTAHGDAWNNLTAAYMHLENSLIEATVLGGGWAGELPARLGPRAQAEAVETATAAALAAAAAEAAALLSATASATLMQRVLNDHRTTYMPKLVPVVPPSVLAMAAAAKELLAMHVRADQLLDYAKRVPGSFRRAIVYGLYNQVRGWKTPGMLVRVSLWHAAYSGVSRLHVAVTVSVVVAARCSCGCRGHVCLSRVQDWCRRAPVCMVCMFVWAWACVNAGVSICEGVEIVVLMSECEYVLVSVDVCLSLNELYPVL